MTREQRLVVDRLLDLYLDIQSRLWMNTSSKAQVLLGIEMSINQVRLP